MLFFKKNSIKNVCLLGLMGSGKSMIGKELSKVYNLEFLDTDQEIEEYTGKSIEYIFKNSGEEYFRRIEEKICLEVLSKSNCIVALGGGSIISSKVRNIIKKNSYSIYLKVDTKILSKRIANTKKRPLLKNVDKNKVLERLYKKRKKFYSEANLIIENNFEKRKVLTKIISVLENYD